VKKVFHFSLFTFHFSLSFMDEQEHSSIGQLIANAARVLSEAGVMQARREAMLLVGHVTKYDRTFLLTHPETILSLSDVEQLNEQSSVARRASLCNTSQVIRSSMVWTSKSRRTCSSRDPRLSC
jgi:hypothetical protein